MTLEQALWQDDNRMSGAVCFRGTRVPVSILFDYIAANETALFAGDFPDVGGEQIKAVLSASQDLIRKRLTDQKVA